MFHLFYSIHSSAHWGKSWAQLSWSPWIRLLRNVEKEGLESPSCMNASICQVWNVDFVRNRTQITKLWRVTILSWRPLAFVRLPKHKDSNHCSSSLYSNTVFKLIHHHHCHHHHHRHHHHHCHPHHCHSGKDDGQDKMWIDLLGWHLALKSPPTNTFPKREKEKFVDGRHVFLSYFENVHQSHRHLTAPVTFTTVWWACSLYISDIE